MYSIPFSVKKKEYFIKFFSELGRFYVRLTSNADLCLETYYRFSGLSRFSYDWAKDPHASVQREPHFAR